MPVEGAIEYVYSRQYKYIKPNASDPGTWRLATPDPGISGGGGGGGGGSHDIDGIDPIVAVTTGSPSVKTTTVSMDIQKLPSRV